MFLKSRRFGWVGVLALAYLCGSVGSGRSQTVLRYKFKEGDKLQYAMEQKMGMQMNVGGNNINVEITQTSDITWNIQSVDKDGKAKLSQRIDRFRFSMDGPMGKTQYDSKEGKALEGPLGDAVGPVLTAMAGAEFTLTMDVQGKPSDVKVPEKLAEALKNAPAQGMTMFSEDTLKQMVSQTGLVLPNDPVDKGKSWNHALEVKSPVGKMKVDNTLTDEGSTERGGKTVEQIALKPKVTLESDPNAAVEVKLKGQDAKGTAYFDTTAGRLVESNTTQTMEMEITVMGQNVAQKMEQTITVKLVGPAK